MPTSTSGSFGVSGRTCAALASSQTTISPLHSWQQPSRCHCPLKRHATLLPPSFTPFIAIRTAASNTMPAMASNACERGASTVFVARSVLGALTGRLRHVQSRLQAGTFRSAAVHTQSRIQHKIHVRRGVMNVDRQASTCCLRHIDVRIYPTTNSTTVEH